MVIAVEFEGTSMKKFILAVLLAALPHLSNAQVEDGIYVIPEINAYSVVLTNNNVVRGYLFSVSGYWSRFSGSKTGDVVEIVEVSESDVEARRITGGGLGAKIEHIFCNPFPLDDEGCQNSTDTRSALPVLRATSALKAIYKTQYGADLVIFDSGGIAVILFFESGNQTAATDQSWIGAYTASIGDDLAIFDFETVVESDESDGGVEVRFELQISDLENPQAVITNFQCEIIEKDTENENCGEIEKNYFSKLIRTF